MDAKTPGLDRSIDGAVADGIPLLIAGLSDRERTTSLRAAGATPAGVDTVIAVHSVSKMFTATAALQCVEDGLIELDAPARDYVPALGDLEVLEGVAADGSVRTRPPARDITARMLLLHTSGLGYEMFDQRYAAIARARRACQTSSGPGASLRMPLLHDPGERWTYGISIDWLGLVVEAVRGTRLDTVVQERICLPCGMTSTSFDLRADMRARLAPLHRRAADGSAVALRTVVPDSPELDMGGQGLFSTVPDVLSLARVWLGDGSAPGGAVLRPETVAWAVRGMPGLAVTPLTTAIPSLAEDAGFPGPDSSWAYSFLVTEQEQPTGRGAGTLSWAGLANVHYWIDRASGIAGVWATQLLPFFDPACTRGLAEFERAAYGVGQD